MSRIAIIGAGQAGTLAAVGLMKAGGYDVSLYSDRTGESILNETHPTGTAFIFGDTVAYERKHGMDTFEDRALPADGVHLYFSPKVGQDPTAHLVLGHLPPAAGRQRGDQPS